MLGDFAEILQHDKFDTRMIVLHGYLNFVMRWKLRRKLSDNVIDNVYNN